VDKSDKAVVRILIVEDNRGDALLVREALKESNLRFELTHIPDGEKAFDYLRRRGENISSQEIEAALGRHPAVLEAAVIGRQDNDQLLKPAACVVLKNGVAGTPDLARELQEFVVSRLPVFKRPRWVEFFDDLPKTATGKLQRFKLREQGK